MQWLIDILAAKVIAEIGVPPCFIDRGDKAAHDWTKVDFTADNNWHVLDLSSIIPTNATAVLFTTTVTAPNILVAFAIKPRLTSGLANMSSVILQVGNIPMAADFAVAIGDNRTVYYFLNPIVFTTIDLSVKGWWL